MRASLRTFRALKVPGRHIAVLKDMGELGDFAPACHEGVGQAAAALSLDLLVCIGDLATTYMPPMPGMDERLRTCCNYCGCIRRIRCLRRARRRYSGESVALHGPLERVVEGLVN